LELSSYCFPDDVFHTSGFLGQDHDVMKLDVVTQVYAVLSHGWFLQMMQPDVLVVLVSVDHPICPV
jgi:hypothetical protein